LFREKFDVANYVNRITPANLKRVDALARRLAAGLAKAEPDHPDGDLIRAEFVFSAELISHVARRTLARQEWLAADPAKRNPEHAELRAKPPAPLKKAEFTKTLRALGQEAAELSTGFESLWLARNKPSRLADVMEHFERLEREYQTFAR
jgi:hypothetical protein